MSEQDKQAFEQNLRSRYGIPQPEADIDDNDELLDAVASLEVE